MTTARRCSTTRCATILLPAPGTWSEPWSGTGRNWCWWRGRRTPTNSSPSWQARRPRRRWRCTTPTGMTRAFCGLRNLRRVNCRRRTTPATIPSWISRRSWPRCGWRGVWAFRPGLRISPTARSWRPPGPEPGCGRRKPRSAMPAIVFSPRSCCGKRCARKRGPGTSRSSGSAGTRAGEFPCLRRNLSGR